MTNAVKPIVLIPFEKSWNLVLEVRAERVLNSLLLEYKLEGDLSEILLPELNLLPERKDLLWEHSCFEAFFSIDQKSYWEFNFSPSTDWNLFHFNEYRSGLKLETGVTEILAKEASRDSQIYRANVSVDLPKAATGINIGELHLGMTAVLENRNGSKSYWALKHLGAKPDFHLLKSFTLRV